MSVPAKHPVFLAAEAAFDSEVLGAVAMAAAERLDATDGRAQEAFIADIRALAEASGADTAWERYGAPAVDAFLSDLEDLRADQPR
jgi:hypothetical protein